MGPEVLHVFPAPRWDPDFEWQGLKALVFTPVKWLIGENKWVMVPGLSRCSVSTYGLSSGCRSGSETSSCLWFSPSDALAPT